MTEMCSFRYRFCFT